MSSATIATVRWVDAEDRRIEMLRAEARHARQKADLYRARLISGRPAEPARLRELERARDQTLERLRHAERERRREGGGGRGREP